MDDALPTNVARSLSFVATTNGFRLRDARAAMVHAVLCDVAEWLRSDDAEAVLIAHQRMDAGRCLCGWAELGRSHARHVAAALADMVEGR